MMSRRTLTAITAICLALAVAPVGFAMFTRAPMGGQMMNDFRPLMTVDRLEAFGSHLADIDAAAAALPPGLAARHPGIEAFAATWPDIHDDMTGMLSVIVDNVDNFAAVDALPAFPMFPWFFLLPGLIGAGLAVTALRASPTPGWARPALVALGIGLIAAPAIFQMFTRAPMGGEMIDDFRPIMTTERIAGTQQAFLVIGGAEGELRQRWLPQADDPPSALVTFIERWPLMAADMAPMIGAMADNLDNFAAVDALPPFDLFPWFFVGPGVLVAGLALADRTRSVA